MFRDPVKRLRALSVNRSYRQDRLVAVACMRKKQELVLSAGLVSTSPLLSDSQP